MKQSTRSLMSLSPGNMMNSKIGRFHARFEGAKLTYSSCLCGAAKSIAIRKVKQPLQTLDCHQSL